MVTRRIIVGYDGSAAANAAMTAGPLLIPDAHAWVAHLWQPPFADGQLRKRLWSDPGLLDAFVDAVRREGAWRADQLATTGVTLARAAGWDAETLVQPVDGARGYGLAQLAQAMDPDVVLVGTRGLSSVPTVTAVLGGVSGALVRHSPKPVLILPYPLFRCEHAALQAGPVVVGWDGSPGSEAALVAANRLLPDRDLLLASVRRGGVEHATAGLSPGGGRSVVPVRVRPGHGPHGRTVAEALAGCARDNAAALLVVGSRGRSTAREILLGSVAMAALHHAHRPVLIVPQEVPGRAEHMSLKAGGDRR
ncbi:universal stress protein [Dactylosporangium sp. NBC_01737]|uniref:universal stress protein n=1 Tax=Dactylosporangium sp. NBC_01737 TaxID=2975959 RepID=UPI002E0F7F26|nr:universal stress protein [Dactylosporangium sp. NBC_01737]